MKIHPKIKKIEILLDEDFNPIKDPKKAVYKRVIWAWDGTVMGRELRILERGKEISEEEKMI